VDLIDDDVPVSITTSASGAGTQGTSKQMNFDEKLNIARTAVTTDPQARRTGRPRHGGHRWLIDPTRSLSA
jgi:hypothetical protein